VTGPPFGDGFLNGPPRGRVPIPDAVQQLLFPTDDAKAIWQNERGGLTFRVRPAAVNPCVPLIHLAADTRFIKWLPPQPDSALPLVSLADEAERLKWARQWTPVPQVLEYFQVPAGAEAGGEVLVTQALAGRPAVDAFWRARPEESARAVGAALRKLHDALPVAECPFDWSVEARVAAAGLTGITIGEALLAEAPEADDLVVCHGDACVPNTLLDNFGYLAGHVDLGRLGVADRWADIAVGAMSTEWNYGPGFTSVFYAGYGIVPDEAKIAYYRRLWDAA